MREKELVIEKEKEREREREKESVCRREGETDRKRVCVKMPGLASRRSGEHPCVCVARWPHGMLWAFSTPPQFEFI